MLRQTGVLIGGLLGLVTAGVFAAQEAPPAQPAPDWAYGYLAPLAPGDRTAPPCPAGAKGFPDCAYVGAPVAENGVKLSLPGAAAQYTRNEAYNDYGPADWYPGDHPTMPAVVAGGKREAGTRACALCHYPNGQGKMENAHVAGLPAAYILQQLDAFKSGARKSADPRKANTNEMVAIARSLTPEEAKQVADYYSSIPFKPWTRVVEAEQAPAVRGTMNGLLLPIPDAAPIPLNGRIIEMPEHPERTEMMRDPRAGFVAYVPVGSIAKGEALATTGGNGKTTRCTLCHGPELKGAGNVPAIAGRTASYTMRQLWDIKQGTRKSPLMAPVVAKLELDELTALTAYVASRQP
jgi:cytochrome c553